MRLTSTIFTLILALPLTAQTPANSSPAAGTASIQFAPHSQLDVIASCPVHFSVDRQPQGAVAYARDSKAPLSRTDPAHHRQGLGITITGERKPAGVFNPIVAAEIVVHGYPAETHIIPAASAASEITESIHLTAEPGRSIIDSTVHTTRIAMVEWLALVHIDFADGTSWQPSPNSRCSASPSLFVLVNATAR